jgi:Holliday junction resolvasome RuvABC endonuclease subunit
LKLFLNKDKKLVTGCWRNNKHGICVLSNPQKPQWEARLKTLFDRISFWLNHIPTKEITIEQLFYDEDQE